jgi:predicted methyltransferase
MRLLKTSFLALLLATPVGMAVAAPANSKPANVAEAVAGRDRPADAIALDESRKPAEVLSFLGLKAGDRALDLMAGSGYYSEIMARAVGSKGIAIAWQPTSFFDEASAKEWTELRARVPNARLFVTPASSLPLAPDSFNFVLLHMVYHDFYYESEKYKFPRLDPDKMLHDIFVATKAGGIVGVVDHVAEPGGDTRQVVDKLHRIDPAVIRADFERAGFVFDGESDLLRNSADDHSKVVFDPTIRGKTDRIVYRFKKPA